MVVVFIWKKINFVIKVYVKKNYRILYRYIGVIYVIVKLLYFILKYFKLYSYKTNLKHNKIMNLQTFIVY